MKNIVISILLIAWAASGLYLIYTQRAERYAAHNLITFSDKAFLKDFDCEFVFDEHYAVRARYETSSVRPIEQNAQPTSVYVDVWFKYNNFFYEPISETYKAKEFHQALKNEIEKITGDENIVIDNLTILKFD